MKKDIINEQAVLAGEPIVIADECGDSMWDAVLQQQVKACDVEAVSNNAASVLNRINEVEVSDTTEA